MNRLKISMTIAAALALVSCGLDEPIYETANPQYGTITLITDWSKMGEGITKPANYTIEVGGHKVTANKDKYTIEHLFEEGTYRGYVYNTAEHITVSNGLATVGSVNNSSTTIEPSPSWFFSASDQVEIKKDTHYEFTAVMRQQIRQLNIELTVTDGDINNIQSVTASLSGVANTIDLKTDVCSGVGLKVEPVFTKNGNKFIASVRLIGLTDEAQNLALDITYVGGSQEQITSNMSNQLTGFGTDKHLPMTLSGSISISESGAIFNSEISGWESQGHISGDADEQ